MTATQPKLTPATDSVASLIFGVYDRLLDHGHAVVDVVVAPARDDGEADWENAGPANVQSLPADEWPADEQVARRAAVLVDHIDGCDPETSMLVFLDEAGPAHIQIAGPKSDGDIAALIIARDIGAKPPVRKPSELADSMARLTAELFPPKPAPVAANDNKPVGVFKVISPADFANKPVPSREWYIDEIIPARNVTLLSGDGGTGKSLLALQIAVAGAMGKKTLGLAPACGRTLVLAAEDEWDELHRRLADICASNDADLSALRNMRVIPAAGQDAELVRADPRGRIQTTEKMQALVDEIVSFKPSLVVLDTSADLFGGNEIDRNQVRFFISALRGLAMELDCTFLLLSHPSVAGMQTGSGISGSTAWNNSVRSRLYLTADKEDEDGRVLKGMKANYGRKGSEIKMRWKDGVFVLDDGKPTAASVLVQAKAERVFREALSAINRSGDRVARTKGVNYAPKIIAERPEAKGVTVKALEAAMQSMLSSGEVRVIMEGPPSKSRQRLILASEDFRLDRMSA